LIGVNNLDDTRVKRRLLGQLSAVPGANLLDNLQVSELVVELNTDLLLRINNNLWNRGYLLKQRPFLKDGKNEVWYR
jgi:hypothetical protein